MVINIRTISMDDIDKMLMEELVDYINKLNITLFKIVDNQGCETRDDDN